MDPELRIARCERDVLLDLRTRVLSTAGDTVKTLSRDLAPSTRHWAAHIGADVVGGLSVMSLRGWALRGMAVAPDFRHRSIGRRLFSVASTEVAAAMWCNARIEAVPFYLAIGWVEVGPIFDIDHQGPHQRMIWTPEHLS